MKKKRKKTINVIPTGKNLLETFIQERFKENSIADSYNPVKEMNLKAFSFMTKVVKSPCKRSDYTNKRTQWIFWQSLIMQSTKKCWEGAPF